jgi:archaellum biogenesis ATPase FlaH
MLESGILPDVNMLSMPFMHMVKSQVGFDLSADIIAETCECFLDHITDRRQLKRLDPIKNNVTLFNIVLDSCVNLKCMIKAQKIMELMSSIRVLADLNTVVIISRIFEMVGQPDEMSHMKRSIDSLTSSPFLQYYKHFYDCC